MEKKEPRNKSITIRLTEKELNKITEIANELKIDRARLARNLLIGETDSYTMKFIRKIGMFKAVLKITDFLDKEHKEIIKYNSNEDYEKATGKKIEPKWSDWLLN